MSKVVALVLERGEYENYGEYANLPVYNAHGNLVGWTGGELPRSGHVCEHAVLDEDGFPVCHSSSEIVKLCDENAKLRERIDAAHLSRLLTENENEKLREAAERDADVLESLNLSLEEVEEENKELKADLEYKVRLLKRDINDGLRENAEMGAALRESEAENAKLREYVRMLAKATVYDPCEWCQHDGDGTCDTETEPMRDGCRLYEEMRELGIEVAQ